MNKIISLYFGDSEFENGSFKTLYQLLTDAWFQMPAIHTGLKLSEKATSPIYLYEYGYHGSMNMCDLVNFDLKKFVLKVITPLLLKPYLFTHPNPTNVIINWIISWQLLPYQIERWL